VRYPNRTLTKLASLRESSSGSDESSSEEISVNSDESEASTSSDLSNTNCINENNCGRDGTVWKEVKQENGGRFASQNVFRAKAGPTNYCRSVQEHIGAFRLFLDEGLLRHIRDCTVEYARLTDVSFTIELRELDAFIGLLFLKGAMNNKNFPYDLLWSTEYGCEQFKRAMSRDRFREIKKMIRFDERSTRSQRLSTDKFALMSYVLERFVDNFQKAYVPDSNLTVDEQLLPSKTRCPFLQYMSNKPDKFGIKFWILAEVETKYCLNIIPYLGKDESRVGSLGTHVVLRLVDPYLNKGYNVCVDNFFTSYQLANILIEKSTSLVGTVRANKRELPIVPKMSLYDSIFYQSGQVNLTCYQAKRNKQISLFSTLHRGNACRQGDKKKPEVIHFYNQNKCGVDLLDSMCKAMTTKSGTRRWPFAVLCNLLDIAAINAWIIYKKRASINITRRQFLYQLSQQLCEENVISRERAQPSNSESLERRVDCGVRINCKKNRTKEKCVKCHKPMCGQCQANICVQCD
jgi:hypothetical protein